MNRILEQDAAKPDEFYKDEFNRLIEKIRFSNQIIERDQEEIDLLKQQSRETLKRIDINLAKIEANLS